MSRENLQSVNQIYSVGHQTLDARRARFLENNIKVEEAFRSDLATRKSVKMAYDPVLQLEERSVAIQSHKANSCQHMKDELQQTHRNTMTKMNGKL